MTAAIWRDLIARVLRDVWPGLANGPRWIEAQVSQESAGNPSARSPVGAVGLIQLMPATAREMGLRVDDQVDERLDPEKNLRAGVRYLKKQFDQLGEIPVESERLLWAFAAYNCGRGYIDFDGDNVADTALELAKRDAPGDWWHWDLGRYWLMHYACGVRTKAGELRHPDYRQVWDYVARIRGRASRGEVA